jgi:DNA protecting protein DprA
MLLQDSMSTATHSKRRQSQKATPSAGARTAARQTGAVPELDETLALLALSSIKGVGYWTLWKIRQQGKTFVEVLEETNDEYVRRTLKDAGAQLAKTSQNDWTAARRAIVDRAKSLRDELLAVGVQVIHRGGKEYPARLNDLSDPPRWLFVQGRVEVLRSPAATIVGTRNPTSDGLWLSRFVGACLHELSCTTVSGLATGIDQEVHQASLRAKVPTVAILGNGVFVDFPKGSEELRKQIIASGGAVVTEYLPRQSYSAENFVRRNRLQAALGSVLVPVEWAAKSGTAHTVNYAVELQRPIACLRMPDWTAERTPFDAIASTNRRLFTIPGEEKQFREFVRKSLRSTKSKRPIQPDFFSGQ